MDNEKSFLQINRKNPLIILLVIVILLVGFVYIYSGTLSITPISKTPTSSGENLPTGPSPSSVSGCSCGWNNNYECGGSLDCKSPSGERSFEKICKCIPSGCGTERGITCGGFSEGTLGCTPNIC